MEQVFHIPLITGGPMLRRNMRREMVTEEELMSQLREQGVGDLPEVKSARMEGDGRISLSSPQGSPREPTCVRAARFEEPEARGLHHLVRACSRSRRTPSTGPQTK